jgi:hypothetical protein
LAGNRRCAIAADAGLDYRVRALSRAGLRGASADGCSAARRIVPSPRPSRPAVARREFPAAGFGLRFHRGALARIACALAALSGLRQGNRCSRGKRFRIRPLRATGCRACRRDVGAGAGGADGVFAGRSSETRARPTCREHLKAAPRCPQNVRHRFSLPAKVTTSGHQTFES